MRIDQLVKEFPETMRQPARALCVPLSPRVPVTDRLQRLVDHTIVQRLRGVRQLAMAHFIYPGATHTRFSHSLGVFHRVAKYVVSLSTDTKHSVFRDEISPREVSALLVAAIMHDAGHYPMAHSFEELVPTGPIPAERLKHDRIMRRVLAGECPALLPDAQADELDDILKEWAGITRSDVLAVLSGRPTHAETIVDDVAVLSTLKRVLDGPLDADKLDYVQRDSHHSGHPGGLSVDEERLIDHLEVRSFDQGLGLNYKGLYAAQSLHGARAAMFGRVYWHRTNRAANRMFTEALSLIYAQEPSAFLKRFEEDLITLDDEAMLAAVAAKLAPEQRTTLVAPLIARHGERQRLFRPLITISATSRQMAVGAARRAEPDPVDSHDTICRMYDSFLRSGGSLGGTNGQNDRPGHEPWKWREFQGRVRATIAELAGGVGIHEVLVDVPDARFETPVHDDPSLELLRSGFWVYDGDEQRSIQDTEPLFKAQLVNWRQNARKVRLYVSPSTAVALAGLEGDVRSAMLEFAELIYGAQGPEDLTEREGNE